MHKKCHQQMDIINTNKFDDRHPRVLVLKWNMHDAEQSSPDAHGDHSAVKQCVEPWLDEAAKGNLLHKRDDYQIV